ncbi:hypothetical protein HispidOSU_012859, partial [Sigmodon hispidus]
WHLWKSLDCSFAPQLFGRTYSSLPPLPPRWRCSSLSGEEVREVYHVLGENTAPARVHPPADFTGSNCPRHPTETQTHSQGNQQSRDEMDSGS